MKTLKIIAVNTETEAEVGFLEISLPIEISHLSKTVKKMGDLMKTAFPNAKIELFTKEKEDTAK